MLGVLPALDGDCAVVTAALLSSSIALRRTVEQYGPLVPEWCPRMWPGEGLRGTLQRCTQEGDGILYPVPSEEVALRTFWAFASAVPPECRRFHAIRLDISRYDSGASPVAVRVKSVKVRIRDIDVFVATSPYINCEDMSLDIWGVAPKNFRRMPLLPSLTSLGLSFCRVDSSVLRQITALTSLTTLRVGGVDGGTTAEWNAFCERLASMHCIKTLELSRVQITDEGVRHFARMRGLSDLTIGGSNVTDVGVRGVMVNPGLRSLSLGVTDGVTDNSLIAIASRGKHITSLTLSFMSNVTNEGLRSVCAHEGITSLALTSLKTVTDEGLRWAERQSRLTSLTLEYLKNTARLQHLQSLHELRSLRLCHIEIGDDDFKVVGTLSSLTSLHIQYLKHLTADGVRALSALPRLRTLHIIDMPHVRHAVQYFPPARIALRFSYYPYERYQVTV